MAHVRRRRARALNSLRAKTLASQDYAAALTEEQMRAWESLPVQGAFIWQPRHAEVFNAVAAEYALSGKLPARRPQSSTDALAQKVRRVRLYLEASGSERMRFAEQALWESSFPGTWERRVVKEPYVPADRFLAGEQRRAFRRRPEMVTAMLACELCDVECDVKTDFLVFVWGVWGRDRVRSDFGIAAANDRERPRAFASDRSVLCPMRCALRIGLEGGRLGEALWRCAVVIAGERLVWVALVPL